MGNFINDTNLVSSTNRSRMRVHYVLDLDPVCHRATVYSEEAVASDVAFGCGQGWMSTAGCSETLLGPFGPHNLQQLVLHSDRGC